MALGSFALLLLAFGYQIHYESPLPFPNTVLPPVAALLLGLGAVGRGRVVGGRMAWGLLAVPVVLAAVPLTAALTRPDAEAARRRDGGFRLVSYNLHGGVDLRGQLDPEAIARVIEAQDPDVVALQEVARGWPISGTVDLAEWLSWRLRMPYRFGPAADGQFGNAVLSALPVLRWDTGRLPAGAGPMKRSYVRAVIGVGDGRTVTVIVTHLQHREENTPTRLLQIEELFRRWGGTPRTVIAGDLNAEPGSPEIGRFEEAGLESAQDATGHGGLFTAPSDQPRHRIDWIFGTPDLRFEGFAIPRTTASDHLPLAVTVSLA
jgi:endonuclease/exonuclease/phosphatase family metal-dependent hydrolase